MAHRDPRVVAACSKAVAADSTTTATVIRSRATPALNGYVICTNTSASAVRAGIARRRSVRNQPRIAATLRRAVPVTDAAEEPTRFGLAELSFIACAAA